MPLLSNCWYEQLALFEVHKSNDFYCILVFYPKKVFPQNVCSSGFVVENPFADACSWTPANVGNKVTLVFLLGSLFETIWPWYLHLISIANHFLLFSTIGNKADLGLYIYLVSISNFVLHGEIIENENVLWSVGQDCCWNLKYLDEDSFQIQSFMISFW